MRMTSEEYREYLKKERENKSLCSWIRRFKGSGYRVIGDRKIYFRSKWEANYARVLSFLVNQGVYSEWQYEPKTFWFDGIKRGTNNYKPDFKVLRRDGSCHWVEVKGYMDRKSATKIKRFSKYYPLEILVVIGEDWFKKNGAKYAAIIKDWE